MFYAQIDEHNICISVTETYAEVNSPNMIKLINFDSDVLNRKYENGQWSVEKFDTVEVPSAVWEKQAEKISQLETLLADVTSLLLEVE